MPLHVIQTEELDKPEYQRNDANRCFHCKTELFEGMKTLGAKLGFDHIAYGMNADDTRDFRPGQRAAKSMRCWRRWRSRADEAGDSRAGQSGRIHPVGSPRSALPELAG